MRTPRFGILTYPYPYRYGESPYQYGDRSFFVFFSHTQDWPFLTKNLGNPNAMAHLSSPKFRQPTHGACKSRIRRTREGVSIDPQFNSAATEQWLAAKLGRHPARRTHQLPWLLARRMHQLPWLLTLHEMMNLPKIYRIAKALQCKNKHDDDCDDDVDCGK